MVCFTLGKKTTISDDTGPLGNIKEITIPEISMDEIETTVYGESMWRTFCSGLKDGGTLGVVLYQKDGAGDQKRLYERAIGDPEDNYEQYTITFPDTQTVVFHGIIVGIPLTAPIDDNITVGFNIKVSGAISGTLMTTI